MLHMNSRQLTGVCQSHITWLDERLGIHKGMVDAWFLFQQAAKSDGFSLKIASGFRDFERQLSIWNRKFSGEIPTKDANNNIISFESLTDEEKVNAILLFSALPGTSRHHWGTDIDVYADNLLEANQSLQLEPWEYEENGPFAPLTHWLTKNSEKFGFFFPYDTYRGGVAAEPWHLSYQPLADICMCEADISCIEQTIKQADILGKAIILEKLPYIMKQYVHNINTSTRPSEIR